MHVQASLQSSCERAATANRQLCVLLDTAHNEGAHRQLERWSIAYHSLFDDTPEASLREIAPLLVTVSDLDDGVRAKLFAWLERSAFQAPCLCWFETGMAATQAAARLRRFHVVGLSQGQSMLMRWYDTRILPVWVACLTAAQAQAFFADTSEWRYVDRLGDVRPLSVTPSDEERGAEPLATSVFGKPLITLTDAQYALLVDAADLSVMLARVRAVIPDETKRVPPRVLAQFVARYMQEAAAAGVKDIDRQAQCVLLALYTSGKAFEQPEFKAFMKSPPATFDAFHKGLQALPDSVWEAGPALWSALPPTQHHDGAAPFTQDASGAR
jgi:Domain of unknown function (DUF4123)